MTHPKTISLFAAAALLALAGAATQATEKRRHEGRAPRGKRTSVLPTASLQPPAANDYFVLEPGHQLVLEHGSTRMQITVLDQTKVINGVTTRVVEGARMGEGPARRSLAQLLRDLRADPRRVCTSARMCRSTRTASSSRPKAHGSPAATATGPGSSSPARPS